MRRSQLFIKTKKQAPADETAKNAQLLIRAGYIHKEMAGVYSYLPLGKIVIEKISQIVREEMNKIGGLEVLMSTLQNKEIWEITGRWDDKKVDNWFKTKLANGTDVGVGLTHEEPLINAIKNFVSSYKDLPIYPYQIQTKFRNELRAKSGLMRGREFLMKDLYSFSRSQKEHDKFYNDIAPNAYFEVYRRLDLGDITYKTFASGGYFSKFSLEFQTLSEVGEDTIYLDKTKRLAVNKEVYSDEVLNDLGLSKDGLEEVKAVEVGNIFPLGSGYSDALGLYFTDEHGQRQSVIMGCYGIGVSRLAGLLAEHFADERGLVWPVSVAPYAVYLACLEDKPEVKKLSDSVYSELTSAGISVLYDDRDERPGEKFADADLLGMPLRLIVSEKSIAGGGLELKSRTKDDTQIVPADSVKQLIVDRLSGLV
ncbi:MAG TPA: aminoacyl--tRNA ligase-related protein [Candidatus Saccharimonadales bacterium]|nr:aminoacyl--tRNA ligase-related protein [Candidatus Saccharimonadales bacterium]